ncbi:MAG: FAD-dependent oxidoreductase [Natronomonas sp.]|uniref:FAD-dependent oxidoreductase n=1 Tax=Natronomonas sp. TaxID=2184060 RepID=UPI00286FF686|nr:FAD-dependent oxidoreductase [Natronomonas sp.]MDR9429923.1 FAD-dependent oxidoreductase [Natronomonas sp.]
MTQASTVETTDVIVVGGGGAGMAAALSARETDADVLLLERTGELGGATAMSIGSYSATGTELQADAGIVDSVDAHIEDIGKFVQQALESPRHLNLDRQGDLLAKDDLALRRSMVERGADTFEWLCEQGLRFEGPYPEPPHRVPRMHNVQPNTDAYAEVLGAAVREAGVDVRTDTPVAELVTDGDRVVGVRTDDAVVESRSGVVLATGGFVADRELRRTFTTDHHAPAVSEHGSGVGHRMARDAGAALRNMDLQWLSFRVGEPLWTEPNVPALTDAGAILVDGDGSRYVNELVDYDQLFSSMHLAADGACYLVFDADVAGAFSSWPDYVSTFPGSAYAYVGDYAETKYLVSATDPAKLADEAGMDADTLTATLDQYNAAATGERIDRYGRTDFAGELRSAPYYALGSIHPYSLITDGGVAVNTRSEALDGDGAPIDGLYAVGDTAAGPLRLGHGHHHLWLFTSGRTAGREAADRVGDA